MGIHQGDTLEKIINFSNSMYLEKNLAIVQKIATPTQIIRKGKNIVGAYFYSQSTVDYIGMTQGISFCIEAKETKELRGLPLINLPKHEFNFMEKWNYFGGKAFLLCGFSELNEYYFMPFKSLYEPYIEYLSHRGIRGYGTLKLDYIKSNSYSLTLNNKVLDYIPFIK